MNNADYRPLAERVRPATLSDYVGQEHIVGAEAPLRKAIENGIIPSIILWGPPGVGKTTLAQLVAQHLDRPFYTLSAINSGVKDIREVIDKVKNQGCSADQMPFCSLMKFIVFQNHNKIPFFQLWKKELSH